MSAPGSEDRPGDPAYWNVPFGGVPRRARRWTAPSAVPRSSSAASTCSPRAESRAGPVPDARDGQPAPARRGGGAGDGRRRGIRGRRPRGPVAGAAALHRGDVPGHDRPRGGGAGAAGDVRPGTGRDAGRGANSAFRSRSVQIMLLCALVRRPLPQDVADALAGFAGELGVEDGDGRRGTGVRGRVARPGGLRLRAQRLHRGLGPGDRRRGGALVAGARGRLGVLDRRRRSWRHGGRALEHLPAEAIGRKVWEMYQARGFTFPGDAGLGSAAPGPARLGARPGRLRHDGRVRGRGVRPHRAGQRRHARLLAPGHGDLAVRDGLPRARAPVCSSRRPGTSRPTRAWRSGWPTPCGVARSATTALTGSDSIDFLTLDWFTVAAPLVRGGAGALLPRAQVGGRGGGRVGRPVGARGHQPLPDERRDGSWRTRAGSPTTPTGPPSKRLCQAALPSGSAPGTQWFAPGSCVARETRHLSPKSIYHGVDSFLTNTSGTARYRSGRPAPSTEHQRPGPILLSENSPPWCG